MSSAVWDDIGKDIATGTAGVMIGGTIGSLLGPGGALLGAMIGGSIAEIGMGAYQKSEAAHTEADQQAAANALELQHQKENISQLVKQQTENLGTYTGQQALEEQQQTTQEQNAYLSANDALKGAQEQIGAQRAAAQGGASNLIAGAASRGIKVGAGAVQSGQDIATGNIVTNPDGSVSYATGKKNIYAGASPLAQLAAYELNASLAIENQGIAGASAANLATGSIKSGTTLFEQQQQQNMAAFEQGQAQQLESARLGYNQSVASLDQQQEFTKTNLQSYDSSLWLSAFSSAANIGTSLLGNLWTPTPKGGR